MAGISLKSFSLISTFLLLSCASNIYSEKGKESYRGLPYHAPTTQIPPRGVERVSAKDLKELLSSNNKPALIDVYGAIFREESLDFDGAWLVSTPRENIPNSVWLPNVGKQELNPVVELYFRTQLQNITAESKEATLVFYCIEDCWMSWNAAKRADEWGYKNVLWFREGVDGWNDNQWSLEIGEPINLPVNN